MPARSSWTTSSDAIAGGGVPHVWRVTATTTGGAGSWNWESLTYSTDPAGPGYAGRLDSARVTLDRQRVPRATVEVALVDVPAAVAAKLDPTTRVDLVVYAGYLSGTPTPGADTVRDWQQIAAGRLQEAETDETGRLVLRGDSVERRILDDSDASWPRLVVATATAAEWIRYVAQEGGIFVDTSKVSGAPGPSQERYANDLWDAIAGTAAEQNWAVVPVGNALELRPIPTTAGSPVADLTTGPGGTLTARRLHKKRDQYANKVKVRFKWTDSTGTAKSSTNDASYSSTDPDNLKTLVVEFQSSPTDGFVSTTAGNILRRMIQRGKTWALQAIAHYWIEPDDAVTVVNPETGSPVTVLVDSVTYSTDGLMDITTREV